MDKANQKELITINPATGKEINRSLLMSDPEAGECLRPSWSGINRLGGEQTLWASCNNIKSNCWNP